MLFLYKQTMPMKSFSITIGFLLTFLLFNCQNSNSQGEDDSSNNAPTLGKACIEKIIAADEKVGKIRNHACEKISMSQTIKNYVDALRKLDFSDCPTNFTKAFEKHINAWEKMIDITNKYPDMRGEMHDLFDELEKGEDSETFKPLLKAIWDTWDDIEKTME